MVGQGSPRSLHTETMTFIGWLKRLIERQIDCGFVFLKHLHLIDVFWVLYIFSCLATVPRVTPDWWISLEQFWFKCRKVIDFALTTLHDWHRVVFIWVSVIQSEVKPKPMELTCTRFPALHVNYMNLLRVLTGSLYFLYPFGFFTLNRPRSNMALKFSGQTFIFGVVFFVSKSLVWELRDKRNLKNLQFLTWPTTKGQRSKCQLSNLSTVANFTLSTQLIKTNYLVILPLCCNTLFYWKLFYLIALWLVICTSVLGQGLKRDSDKAKTLEKVYIHLKVVVHQGLY